MNYWGLIFVFNVRDPFLMRYDLRLVIQTMICKRVVIASVGRLHGELHFLMHHLLHQILGFAAQSPIAATGHPVVDD